MARIHRALATCDGIDCDCHHRRLIETEPEKWAAYLDPRLPPVTGTRRPCVHLGEATGDTVPCTTCKGKVSLKVFACGKHGTCTKGDTAAMACCANCRDYDHGGSQLIVSALGAGDHIYGLTVAKRWQAANPGKHLVYVVKHTQWVELFDGYDALAYAPDETYRTVHPELTDRGNLHWVEAVSRVPGRLLPEVRPLPAEAVAWAEEYRGCIVLAPLTLAEGATTRNWLMSHWEALERRLADRGVRCVIICGGDDQSRLGRFTGPIVAGRPAAYVAALMRAAAAVVSNESGMAHLAGALRVPCVVLAAQLDAQAIHGIYPRSVVLQAPLPCSGCRWGGPHWRPHCDTTCANLQTITPDAVMTALAPMLGGDNPRREVEMILAKLTAPDRRATMRGFLDRIAGPAPVVVETGCQRQAVDYGAGMSTSIFARWLDGTGGTLWSLDNDADHVALARRIVPAAQVVLTDSVAWLREYNGPPIAGLYLDSKDTYVPGHAEHCLDEAMTALPHLAPDAVVLIDDTPPDGEGWSGKGRLAVPWLMEQGWRVVADGYQVLLHRT